MRLQQPLQQQMLHLDTHENATIARIILLRRILQIDKADGTGEQLADFVGGELGFAAVGRVEGVVVEGDAVDDADEEEGPVRATLGDLDVAAVVDGEEDVRCAGEVGEGFFEGERVGGLH